MQNIHLGFIEGTSGDGVDASIINSNGVNEFESIKDKFEGIVMITFLERNSMR